MRTNAISLVRVTPTTNRRPGASLVVSGVVLAIVVIAAIAGQFVVTSTVLLPDLGESLKGMSLQHPLGTDVAGRDLLALLVVGSGSSLLFPLVVVAVSTVMGITIGLLSGWNRGWVDGVLSRFTESLLAFPSLLLAILAVAIFGNNIWVTSISLAIAFAPGIARLTRSLIAAEKTRPYVATYSLQGFSPPFVAITRVLPNVLPTVLAQALLNYGFALVDLVGLSFLGLGVQQPNTDWGGMIADGIGVLTSGHPLPSLVPAIVVIGVVVAFNSFCSRLPAALATRRKNRG